VNNDTVGKVNLLLGPFNTLDLSIGGGLISFPFFDVVKNHVSFGVHIHTPNIQQIFHMPATEFPQPPFLFGDIYFI